MTGTRLPRRFDLIIFDCDGVVVDSERIVQGVFARFVRSLGADLDDREIHERFLGRSLADCIAIVERHTGAKVPPGALDHYRAERDRVLREQVQPVAGIRAVLETLTTPYCIASSGDHDKMRITLGATALLPLFEGRLFSAADVARAKPAPDVFLLAAATLGVGPARCAVVEDTVNGVLAGRAAGMTVYGFAGLMASARLLDAGAHAVFTSMRELPALLERADG
jgi:HAD superfamily hydrolase (TIGR01509 family)